MKHARPDYDRIQDPLNLIPQDEPVFLIRSSDRSGPYTVEAWIRSAHGLGAKPDILEMAKRHADLMRQWQEDHGSKIPDLPEHCDPIGMIQDWVYVKRWGLPGIVGMYEVSYITKQGNPGADIFFFGSNGQWWNTSNNAQVPVSAVEVYAYRPHRKMKPAPVEPLTDKPFDYPQGPSIH